MHVRTCTLSPPPHAQAIHYKCMSAHKATNKNTHLLKDVDFALPKIEVNWYAKNIANKRQRPGRSLDLEHGVKYLILALLTAWPPRPGFSPFLFSLFLYLSLSIFIIISLSLFHSLWAFAVFQITEFNSKWRLRHKFSLPKSCKDLQTWNIGLEGGTANAKRMMSSTNLIRKKMAKTSFMDCTWWLKVDPN